MAQSTAPQRAGVNPSGKGQERIYSAQQLVMALRSGMSAIRDQIQVLSILDGTAAEWPGVNQALDDMESLMDMSSKTTYKLEEDIKTSNARTTSYKSEVMTLKEALSHANERCEQLQSEVSKSTKDMRQLTSKLETVTGESNQQRQELWTGEQQRADFASELEKYEQDTDFMEGEIGSLRSTVNEQMQQLTALKEELAARKADVQHLQRSSQEHKATATELKKRLDAASGSLRTTQSSLEHSRSDKQHFEKESGRLAEESARLGSELSKTVTEMQRLRDWTDVMKKVESDKLREEQAAHTRTRFEAEQAKAELGRTIARLTAELNSKDERLISKTAEAHGATKQLGLLNIQVKDLQKQLMTLQAERANVFRERDEGRAEVAKMQAKMQASAAQLMKCNKDRMTAETRLTEQASAERGRLQDANDEARRETSVHKALAEGWSRDIKDLKNRLQAEQAQSVALRAQVETLIHGCSVSEDGFAAKNLELVKNLAGAEQAAKALQAQLSSKDVELRRSKAEFSSREKRLDKQVESLQRECDECAAELQRLRDGDAGRLPPVQHRPVSLQDELDNLKRYVHHGPNGSVPVHLPPAVMQFKRSLSNTRIKEEGQLEGTPRAEPDSLSSSNQFKVAPRALSTGTSIRRLTQVQAFQDLQAQVEQLQAALDDAERRVFAGDQMRRKMHNMIQELKGNIRVFCRVRPLIPTEIASKEHDSDMALALTESEDPISMAITLQSHARDGAGGINSHTFAFDKVFDIEATQAGVFKEISELVQSSLDGHRVCIFAYGQTGSGKTFTMMGDQEHPGIIPRAMQQIFDCSQRMEKEGWAFTMQVSMLEIYNEEYRDLLSEIKPEGQAKHQVIHNPDGTATVTDLTVVDISQPSRKRNSGGTGGSLTALKAGQRGGNKVNASAATMRKGLQTALPDRVSALLAEAMHHRSVGCTALNEQSSRSHMVFTMKLIGVHEAQNKTAMGVLNLIDLAGSERVKDSGSTGIRLKEAQAINTSLSALGDVMVALGNKQQHVPYRNSKLTYLLQPSLGGDAKALMFVNVAPSMHFSGESLCSLRFAAKVNAVEINPKKKPQRHGSALSKPAISSVEGGPPTLDDA